MIKIVYCLRRKAELSVEEFQKYWLETHAAFGANIPGVKRYVQAHTLGGELAETLAAGHPASRRRLGMLRIPPLARLVRHEPR